MKFSISQILAESWDDLKKLVVNPVVLILFLVWSVLLMIPELLQKASPLLALLAIPFVLLMLFIYAYQVKLIYNLKKGETQNVFSEVLSTYPRYLWYTLIFTGILIAAALVVAVPAGVLYFMLSKQAVWILFLAMAVYIPVVIYISIKLFFYLYLIVLEKDKTPLSTSWEMTKTYFWKIILLMLILFAIFLVIAIIIGIIVGIIMVLMHVPENMQDTAFNIILLPLEMISSIYMTTAFLNMFLFCRARSKP